MKFFASREKITTASSGFWLCVGILAALTVVRIVALQVSVVDLYVDEAQYWVWSREPAFGYFSKPPLLAWIIAAAEGLCGSGEACLRAPAPIFYFATSLTCYAVARELYDQRVAFWTALTVALATGAVFSARIISTDVPLLFFWSVALLAYVKLLRRVDWRWGAVLGVSLGFGLLAKYAMIYFLLGVALAAVLDRDARRLATRRKFWIALAIAAVCIAPNILWNAHNSFATFRHTGDNIEGSGLSFALAKGLAFVGSQFAVFGPVVFATLLILVVRMASPRMLPSDRILLAFAIPVLALITATAFVTRAHPNWAATAFVSAAIATTAALVRWNAWRWIAGSLGLGLIAQLGLMWTDARADRVSLPFIKRPDVYERTIGWRALGAEAKLLAERSRAGSVASDNRSDVAALLYYLRDARWPVRAWKAQTHPQNHFELTRPLTEDAAQPVLFISPCGSARRLERGFGDVTALGAFDAATGPTSKRRYYAFLLGAPRGPIGAVGGC